MKSLFERSVLKNRLHFIKCFNEKEWWYSGLQFQIPDEENKNDKKTCFIGISECRSIFIDSLAVVYYDGNKAYPVQRKRRNNYLAGYYLKKNLKKGGGKSLEIESKKIKFKYFEINGDGESNGYKLELHMDELKKYDGGKLDVNVTLKKELPVFTKNDDYFGNYYNLENYFFTVVQGSVSINGKKYDISKGGKNYMYQDHCSGNVPRKTKWHWIAVWNEKSLLDVLCNYGVYPQLYSQVYFPKVTDDWERLEQNVAFEYENRDKRFEKRWKVTSTDLDLHMELLGTALEREAIPFTFMPLLINLYHYQCFAHVWGKIKVDGRWIETGDMFGVFEEHHGKW